MSVTTHNTLPSTSELLQKPLYVFALESEATHEFKDVNTLFVGIGKLNAMYNLMKNIHDNKPSIIINLGSAGSTSHKRGEVVCCTNFVQRDMDVTALGFEKYQTPFSVHLPVLEYGIKIETLPHGICGTGDSFVMDHNTEDYNVIDMEAYPLALIAKQENIPFLCLKYISDGADDTAAVDWPEMVKNAAKALKHTLNNIITE